MTSRCPMRCVAAMTAVIVWALLCAQGAWAQSQQEPRYQHPAPIVRRPPSQQAQQQSARPQQSQPQQRLQPQGQPPRNNVGQHYQQNGPQQNGAPLAKVQKHENPGAPAQGEHLSEWLSHHSNMTPEQQQRALANEPGFRELPAQTQQRMRDRITQLNSMPPSERERILAHNEAMEHLTPDQRGQVRGAMGQLATLPPDRRHFMEKTFRSVRNLPPQQRQAYLNSPQVRGQFTPEEFSTLNRLMSVEPLLPRNQ